MSARESLNPSELLQSRNMQDSARERAARQSGRLPQPAPVASNRRSELEAPPASSEWDASAAWPTPAPPPPPPPPTLAGPLPSSPIPPDPSQCVACDPRQLQAHAAEMRKCLSGDELREMLHIPGGGARSVCLLIVVATVFFTIGFVVPRPTDRAKA